VPPIQPHAMNLAIALQQCVTGLTLGEVHPRPVPANLDPVAQALFEVYERLRGPS
jgi:hypothetical protein